MTLVYACIAPHGSEAITKLASKSAGRKFRKTREGLCKLAKEVGRAKPETIVIASPHNLKLWRKIAVVTAENSTGTLQASPRNKKHVSLKAKCDVEFATKLLERATKENLPVVGANYGTSEGVTSDMPMDWGTLVPLWFIIPQCKPKPKVVIVTPSREIPLLQNFQFGKLVGELSERKAKRIVFVASADQAHRHKKSGPYGFSKAAREYDRRVLHAIEKGRMDSIMRLKPKLVEAARPDSLWQMTMLAGVLDKVSMSAETLSYHVPTYFGMICASFRRNH
jgi:aromatic ring-opening dioxygenase LigB subunit